MTRKILYRKCISAFRNLLFLFVAVSAIVSVLGYFGVRILYLNTSESAVRGLYVVRPTGTPNIGDMVIVPLPQDVASLEKGTRMLKRVCGVSGDIYLVNGDVFYVRGEAYPVIHHPLLPVLRDGVHVVGRDRLLLLNPHRMSLDSRYFGEFNVSSVECCVVCFFTFEPFYAARIFFVREWGWDL